MKGIIQQFQISVSKLLSASCVVVGCFLSVSSFCHCRFFSQTKGIALLTVFHDDCHTAGHVVEI
jgi:hypothetical protein